MEPKDIYFQLPKTSIKGIPVFSPSGVPISFGFVEVGCQSKRKRRQIKSHSQLFLKYWGDNYRGQAGFTPLMHRVIAYYDPSSHPELVTRGSKLDAVIFYSDVSPEMLAAMDERDRKDIYSAVSDNRRRRGLLEEVLEENDAERLHRMIVDGKQDQTMSTLRGKMAEILVQKDISSNLPDGMNFFRNTNIWWTDQRYTNGTEVDGLLQSYGEPGYVQLVANLRELEHLKIRDRWHTNQY